VGLTIAWDAVADSVGETAAAVIAGIDATASKRSTIAR
jgi:hypothetical protein